MKHTPGPWAYFENCTIGYSIFQANAEDDGYEATVLATAVDEEDANIIAAAPETVKRAAKNSRFSFKPQVRCCVAISLGL